MSAKCDDDKSSVSSLDCNTSDNSDSDADANDHDADAATDVSHVRHRVKAMGRPAIHTRCKVMARPVVKDKLGTQTGRRAPPGPDGRPPPRSTSFNGR